MRRTGRVLLFTLFGLLLAALVEVRVVMVVIAGAAVCAFVPAWRQRALFAATLAGVLLNPAWCLDAPFIEVLERANAGGMFSVRNTLRIVTLVFFAGSWLLLRHAAHQPTAWLARHPVLCMFASIAVLSAVALQWPSIWLLLGVKIAASYMWFLCYAIVDQRAHKGSTPGLALGMFHPFWGSPVTPIGKGSAYIAKLTSHDPQDLAVTQLKALKLLVWALLLAWSSRALTQLAGDVFGIPPLAELLDAFVRGQRFPRSVGWGAVAVATAIAAIELAAWGHQVVACARLAGWRLRRNSWRPLRSRSLADFWNRYYYYFKELLVDFFFYPTFLRCWKRSPRLRVFFATFVAAGVGNALYHFVRDIDLLFTMGVPAALEGFESYLVYCFVLALGIGISQLRRESPEAPHTHGRLRQVWAASCVWAFVACIHVFGGIEARTHSLSERAAFMAHQLGIQP